MPKNHETWQSVAVAALTLCLAEVALAQMAVPSFEQRLDSVRGELAISGTDIVVCEEDAVLFFEEGAGGVWSEVATFDATTLGIDLTNGCGIAGDFAGAGGVASGGFGNSVYLFERVAGVWQAPTRELQTPHGNDLSLFFDMSGDDLVIGGRGNGATPADLNTSYVYSRSGGTWFLAGSLAPTPPTGFARFSRFEKIAIDGDVVAMGSPLSNTPLGGADSGLVVVFRRTSFV